MRVEDKERPVIPKDLHLSALRRVEARGLDAIVALLDRSGSLIIREFGELKSDRLAPAETLVDLGSITKTVTAIAVLKLVEQRNIELSDTLSLFWPETPREKAQITVHQLLTHTSGLPEDVGEDEEPLKRKDFIRRVLAQDLTNTPGSKFHYSNAGYGVLAAMLELRSNTSFENFVAEKLLKPAGIGSIGYVKAYRDERSMRTPRSAATLFQRRTIREASWGGRAPGWNLVGNGGLVSTPVTFLRFWRAVREGRIVRRTLLEQALTPHIKERERGPGSYGYGLFIRGMPNHGRTYGHDGGNQVFTAEWLEIPQMEVIIFTAGLGEAAIDAMELMVE